jgi:tetratricopeptide (TPR) repeat protein
MGLGQLVETGITDFKLSNYTKAKKTFKKSIALCKSDEELAIIYYNLGLCCYALGEYKNAAISFELSSRYGRVKSNWELCLSKLHLQDMDGFNYYKFRPDRLSMLEKELPVPEIVGLEDLKKRKKIIVLNEQGFGDEILFSRGIALLEGIDYSYQVYPENLELFKKLFKGNFFVDRTLSYNFIEEHDGWILSGDLFTLYTKEKGLLTELPVIEKEKNIGTGFCYNTNQKSPNSHLRSIPLSKIRKILKGRDNLVSLQKDIKHNFAYCPELNTFLDTYNIVKNLKEVITIDTSVAHLSALCNIKTYILYDKYLDWRWKFQLYGEHVIPVQIKEYKTIL